MLARLQSLNPDLHQLPETVIITSGPDGYTLKLGGLVRGPARRCDTLIELAALQLEFASANGATSRLGKAPPRAEPTTAVTRPAEVGSVGRDGPIQDAPATSRPVSSRQQNGARLRVLAGPTLERSASNGFERGARGDVDWGYGPLSLGVGATLWQDGTQDVRGYAALTEARVSGSARGCWAPVVAQGDWRIDGCLGGRYDQVSLDSADLPQTLGDAGYSWLSAQATVPLTHRFANGFSATLEPGVTFTPDPARIESDAIGAVSRRAMWSYSLTVQVGYALVGGI